MFLVRFVNFLKISVEGLDLNGKWVRARPNGQNLAVMGYSLWLSFEAPRHCMLSWQSVGLSPHYKSCRCSSVGRAADS